MGDRFIRIREVMRLTGLARSTIFLMSSTGRFPKQIALGCAASGWLESEVIQWCDAQVRVSRNVPLAGVVDLAKECDGSKQLGVAKGGISGKAMEGAGVK